MTKAKAVANFERAMKKLFCVPKSEVEKKEHQEKKKREKPHKH